MFQVQRQLPSCGAIFFLNIQTLGLKLEVEEGPQQGVTLFFFFFTHHKGTLWEAAVCDDQ